MKFCEIDNPWQIPIRAIINPKFNQTFAIAMTDFGSLDIFDGIPAGSAHFLEHKLFAKPHYDSAQRFAQAGASSNAFTTYTKTAYLFKTVTNVADNLEILLDLISQPYFTTVNVAQERGIIAQEIQMYTDMPDWIVEQATLAALYPQDAIDFDIAGTTDSIAQITAPVLNQIYTHYYLPQNFCIYLAGKVDLAEINAKLQTLADHNHHLQMFAQRHGRPQLHQNPHLLPVVPQTTLRTIAQRPRFMLGLRLIPTIKQSCAMITLQNQLEFLFAIILGDSSKIHQTLVRRGLIDDSFGYTIIVERYYALVLISGESDQPQVVAHSLENYLFQGAFISELTRTNLQMVQRENLGSYVFLQDYLENLATEAVELAFYDLDVRQMPQILQQIQLKDLKQLAEEIFQKENWTQTFLYPQ